VVIVTLHFTLHFTKNLIELFSGYHALVCAIFPRARARHCALLRSGLPRACARDLRIFAKRGYLRARIDDMQIQVAEIRTEVKIQSKEVFARVKRLEAIMIGASASIIAMLVMVLTRMP
jgi:hypothetical protein